MDEARKVGRGPSSSSPFTGDVRSKTIKPPSIGDFPFPCWLPEGMTKTSRRTRNRARKSTVVFFCFKWVWNYGEKQIYVVKNIPEWIPKFVCFRVLPRSQLIFIGTFWCMRRTSFFSEDAFQCFDDFDGLLLQDGIEVDAPPLPRFGMTSCWEM